MAETDGDMRVERQIGALLDALGMDGQLRMDGEPTIARHWVLVLDAADSYTRVFTSDGEADVQNLAATLGLLRIASLMFEANFATDVDD